MNRTLFLISITAVAALAACNKVSPIEVASTPTPAPAVTPHPATGAKQRAVELYPDLAKADSMFNRTFVDLFEQKKNNDPEFLTTVDWPLDLARTAGSILGVRPFTPTPTPPPPQIIIVPARTPTALDRGAYNEKGTR